MSALRLMLIPTKFASQPFSEARSIAVNVVALLEQHDVRLSSADNRQCFLRSLINIVSAVEYVPH
jgi:hypothetical protein